MNATKHRPCVRFAVLVASLVIPTMAESRPVTVTTTLKRYSGDGAYLAVYVTDLKGIVHSTMHIAGPKAKYYKHLNDWNRATGNARKPLDGVTGASVGSGRTLVVRVELADALIDAGYQVRVDSAVEKQSDHPSDAVVPLSKVAAGKALPGKGYVQSVRIDF